jgi:phosphosulfolactate synthase
VSETHIFDGLDGTSRPDKPRRNGLTMVVDWGMGAGAQEDLVSVCGPYFDFAKVAVGISRLLSNAALVGKISHYRDQGVEAFPGGQYLEYAEVHGKADVYLPAVVKAGYRWMEVSDNLASVSLEWKARMIREATEQHGLSVLGEVGKKEGLSNDVKMSEDARVCLEAGSSIILLEAAELIGDDADTAREVEAVVDTVGLDRVMFERPGPWIEGVTLESIHRMRRDLVDRYGKEVNVGNVQPDDLMTLEAYRRELGINAGKQD